MIWLVFIGFCSLIDIQNKIRYVGTCQSLKIIIECRIWSIDKPESAEPPTRNTKRQFDNKKEIDSNLPLSYKNLLLVPFVRRQRPPPSRKPLSSVAIVPQGRDRASP